MILSNVALLGLSPLAGLVVHWGAGWLSDACPYSFVDSEPDSPRRVPLRLVLPVAVAVALWSILALPQERSTVGCLLGWTLQTLAVVDWQRFVLPDALTLPLIGAGLVVAAPDQLVTGIIGAALGYAVPRAIAVVYFVARGREGLGQGDAKLLAAGGAWVGWEGLGSVILTASALGLAWAVAALRMGVLKPDQIFPFGPFLCLGIWIVWTMGGFHGA